ncbi:MAG: glycosyltransferase family 39 protein [Bacteroidota bacterium]
MRTFVRQNILLLSFAAAALLIHLVVNAMGGYGYFRDELYYFACSEHLDWGYVDQPPLSIFILALNRVLFGDSLFALRLLPAVAAAVTVFFTGLMAREFGGNRFAQSLASVGALASPIFLGMFTIFSMNCFDFLFWTLAAFIILKILKTEQPRYWIILGIVLGFGLLNKIDVLWLGFGIFLGLVLTPQRHWLKTKWPWVAGAIAFILFLPYILWNMTHGFAHWEFINNATALKYSSQTPITFIVGQFLLQNPMNMPLWICGLCWLLFVGEKRFRFMGFIWLAAFLVLLVNGHSKAEYLAPAYMPLFAAGGVALERWLSGKFLDWLRPTYLGLVALGGIFVAPLVLPVLPVQTYIRYAESIGMGPTSAEGKQLNKLPQFYADMFGWDTMAATVAGVYRGLSAEDQARCGIYADNYGEAGAIDFFGKKYGLPKAVSGHNNYFLWGTRGYSGEVVIVIGGNPDGHRKVFESVEEAAVITSEYAMPYESNLPVYVCRKIKVPLQEVWPSVKSFI